MSCLKTLKLLFVTGSPGLGGRGVAPTVFDVASEDGAGEGCGVGVVAGEGGGGEGGGVILTLGSEDGDTDLRRCVLRLQASLPVQVEWLRRARCRWCH